MIRRLSAATVACAIEVLRFMASFPFRQDPVVLAAALATTALAADRKAQRVRMTTRKGDCKRRINANVHLVLAREFPARVAKSPGRLSPYHPLDYRQISL